MRPVSNRLYCHLLSVEASIVENLCALFADVRLLLLHLAVSVAVNIDVCSEPLELPRFRDSSMVGH